MTNFHPNAPEASTLTNTSFAGASSIALRFSDPTAYQMAVLLYGKALNMPVPTNFKESYSFAISPNLELLCTLQKPPLVTDGTIIYWEVGSTTQEIDEACLALGANGYKLLENPKQSPLGPADKPNTLRAVLEDKSGHRTGVIINPPVPFIGPAKDGQEVSMPPFVIEPTHVINPPTTVDGGGPRPE